MSKVELVLRLSIIAVTVLHRGVVGRVATLLNTLRLTACLATWVHVVHDQDH